MHSRIIRTLKDDEYQYEIYDTSLNGTYVNDHKISGSVVLNDGDVIVFGHLRGAVLGPGAYAPQKDSEFIYKVSKGLAKLGNMSCVTFSPVTCPPDVSQFSYL